MPSDLGAIQSLRAVDAWIDIINANINGGVRTAYKASRLRFSGGTAEIGRPPTAATLPLQFPGPTLETAETKLDLTQGAIAASSVDTHAAIQGEGFFLVVEPLTGKVMLTRDGEFHRDASGLLVNGQGLIAVDRAMAINLDPTRYRLNLPTLTGDAVNDGSAGWYPAGAGIWTGTLTDPLWFPYVPGTVYDEGPNNYQYQNILVRRTFFLDGSDLTGTLSIRLANVGRIVINGVEVKAADVTPAYPIGTAATTVDLTPYLRAGANTIGFRLTESSNGANAFQVSGTIGGQIIPNDATWATMVQGPNQTAPLTADEIRMLSEPDINDLVLVNGPRGDDLQFTRYGSTVWEWAQPPDIIAIDLPGQNGAGIILTKALEASNSSMTQSVPELSLAQKLFSALTKVIQTHQTNRDAILNTIR